MNQQNQPLSEGEKRKLESEIAKNEAEEKKLNLEAEEVQKRLRRKWYSIPVLGKWLVGGVVTAVLVSAWIVVQLQPILSREQKVDGLEYQIDLLELKLTAKKIEADNADLRENLAKAQEGAEALQAGFKELKAEYDALAQNVNFRPDQRTEFAELSKTAEKRVDSINVDIEQIRKTRREVDLRAKTIRPIDQRFQPIPVERDS